MVVRFVQNREGDMVPFDAQRIYLAVKKAVLACGGESLDVEQVVANVVSALELLHETCSVVDLEHIQDIVEKELMKMGAYDVAKQYILYRQKHAEEREKKRQDTQEKFEHHQLKVTKSDGSWEFFDIEKVRTMFLKVNQGYEEICSFVELETGLLKYLVDGMRTADIIKMMVKVAIDLISLENIHWQVIA